MLSHYFPRLQPCIRVDTPELKKKDPRNKKTRYTCRNRKHINKPSNPPGFTFGHCIFRSSNSSIHLIQPHFIMTPVEPAVTASGAVSLYVYIPSLGANATASFAYCALLVAQIYFMFKYRQWWFGGVFCIGTFLEAIGYICRSLSSKSPDVQGYFILQMIVLTVAPTFLMASIYSLPAKLAVIFGYPQVSRFRPRVYSVLFLTLDVLSLLTQFAGAGIAGGASSSGDRDKAKLGSNIMLGGMIIQVIGISVFFAFFIDLLLRARNLRQLRALDPSESLSLRDRPSGDDLFNPAYAHVRAHPMFSWLLHATIASTLFIFARSIYRVVELAEGWNGYLMVHEIYIMLFEAILIFFGILCLTIVYPGMVLGKGRFDLKAHKNLSSYELS